MMGNVVDFNKGKEKVLKKKKNQELEKQKKSNGKQTRGRRYSNSFKPRVALFYLGLFVAVSAFQVVTNLIVN